MKSLETSAGTRVCEIADDLCSHQAHILTTAPLRRRQDQAATATASLGGALTSLLHAPAQAITQTLFGAWSRSMPATAKHLRSLDTMLLDLHGEAQPQGLVWLAWDDCRCLFQVFRNLEYVDTTGKPTSLVDGYVSRLTAGEAASKAAAGKSKGAASSLDTTAAKQGISGGASRLWGWAGNSGDGAAGDGDGSAADAHSEERVRTAAWQLISNIFARATALRISAEAEEVSESDGQAVLTWFPQLEYLEIQSIPRESLRFWDTWLPNRISCLSVRHAGIELNNYLDLSSVGSNKGLVRDGSAQPAWRRLTLLDLSGNPGIDLAPLRDTLSTQLPNIARLSLSKCELVDVPGSLTALYNLSWLDLHANSIASVSDISLKLGGIVRLNLAQNCLTELSGLHKLWALEMLDVSNNELDKWSCILVLRNLPSLSVLNISGNPFTSNTAQPYRPLAFSAFDHRDVPLLLDGRGPTSQERKEMAKIPRMATGHQAGVSKQPEAPVLKARKPKLALIEESAEAGEGSYDGQVAVEMPRSANSNGASRQSIEEPSTPAEHCSSSIEKTARVLRAAELQAITIASTHRRSSTAKEPLASPVAHSISMNKKMRLKRRATAAAVHGPPTGSTQHSSIPQNGAGLTYSVPSSYSSRPTSPAPSTFAPSMRTGTAVVRDPERYRRKVEMMRAEAGSSWLRAFAELQAQSPSISPVAPTSDTHFEEAGQPASARAKTEEHPKSPSSAASSEDTHDKDQAAASQQPTPDPAKDTRLPSFLFPRRKTARKKGIGSLPRYSETSTPAAAAAAEEAGPADETGAGVADANKVALPGPAENGEFVRTVEDCDEGNSPIAQQQQQSQPLGELQLLLNGDGVNIAANQVVVTRFQLIPLADSPLSESTQTSNGNNVIQRMVNGTRRIYITADCIVEVAEKPPNLEPHAEGASSVDCMDSLYIASKVPLSSIVRIKMLHDKLNTARVEIKAARFDSPSWIEYHPEKPSDTGSEFKGFVDTLQSAANANNSAGLSESVYKQAECLRCSWHGYVDSEREIFNMIDSGKELLAVPPPPVELQCPKCKRSYLREFYASDEKQSSDDNAQAQVSDIWKQPFISRRNRSNSAAKRSNPADKVAGERHAEHAQHRRSAQRSLGCDIDALGNDVADGYLPFAKSSNAISLFLQLSVFEADSERLMQWVPAGLIRQIHPTIPRQASAARPSSPAGNSKPVSASKWGLSSFLSGTTAPAVTESAVDAAEEEAIDVSNIADKRSFAADSDWRASAALAPEVSEQAVYLALSSHAVYVFSPTWDVFRDVSPAKRAAMDLQPELYLGLIFSIPLTTLGRIDIGPNRQYLALHSSLLSVDGTSSSGWSDRQLQRLLTTPCPAYPLLGYTRSQGAAVGDSKDSEKRPSASKLYTAQATSLRAAQHKHRLSLFSSGSASSCVFMIRDRLACSDLLDSLVEIGYETRALDSGAGVGSGRLRAINHDVEWAMHHLVQQVFLRPSTFELVDDDDGDDKTSNAGLEKPATLRSVADEQMRQDQRGTLRKLQDELLRTRSGRQPGAMVDPASGDNVIIDKVTYEFLKLYFCVGHVPTPLCAAESTGIALGIQPLTLVGSPQFLYLVRERLDVWPPPVPDLRALYRKWQRIAPPTIVTSDPDTYDPKALAEELAQRSNAPSTTSPATSKAASTANSAATSIGNNQASSSPTVQVDAADNASGANGASDQQLMSSIVSQYDRVEHARPISDLRRISFIPRSVTVIPKQQQPHPSPSSQADTADEKPALQLDRDTLGCAGTSWRAMLRIEFATQSTGQGSDASLEAAGWNIWFATVASARECIEALQALAASAGVPSVDFCEL
ncbi:hypothetical protein GGI12_001129 [Dipsacomyces acuminosporus]|nr:hypothetical protein GGI12_001129 [Dipsacomyces acuminosporus]